MPALHENSFAVLTAVVAPAILTNACSVLSLGTANRIARVVDRTRVVIAARAALAAESADYQVYSQQLDRLAKRGRLLLNALRIFYASLGAFAATALLAVIGSALSAYDFQTSFHTITIAGFAVGGFGVSALVVGCAVMVRETQLAITSMSEEIELAHAQKNK